MLEEVPGTGKLQAGLASQVCFARVTTDGQVSAEVVQPQHKGERQGSFSTDCRPEGLSPKHLNKGMLLPPEVTGFAHKLQVTAFILSSLSAV